ncbi:MAG: PTS sugar transporter subunit IIA [Candidatus Zixiibacteriota bacterium]
MPLKLSNFFDPELILTDLKAQSKSEAIEEIINRVASKHPGIEKETVVRAIQEREELGPTSFGRGFCFPHARTDQVRDMIIAVGISREGIRAETPDQIALHVFFLLMTPRNISRLYLQTLSALANLARRPESLQAFLKAETPQGAIDIIGGSGLDVKEELTVKDIMNTKPVTVTPQDSLKEVANLLFKHHLSGVFVVDKGGKVLGEITEEELIKAALPDYGSLIANLANLPELEPFDDLLRKEDEIRVREVFDRKARTVEENAPVVEVAAMMLFKRASRVAVMREGRFVGEVLRSDIVSKIIRG